MTRRSMCWRRAAFGVALAAWLVACACFPAAALAADPAPVVPRLATVFGDGMVLQRDRPVPIWGWAAPGTPVTVAFAGQSMPGTTQADGRWQVQLTALPASAESRPLQVVFGEGDTATALTLHDVLVGDVWLCSGQSNMQFELDRALNAEAEVAAADYPQLRLFQERAGVAREPQQDVKGKWEPCTPASAKKFSAVAYFFGRELLEHVKVPIGLVHASQGWTPGEAWMSREALLDEPELRYIADRWDAATAMYPQAKAAYDAELQDWTAAGDPTKPKPRGPVDPNFIHRASGFYNGAIAPLAPLALRGVIWYQGETNDSRGYQYRVQFPALIRDWRRTFENEALPFLFVQVANVLPPDPTPVHSEWAELRESQALALALPHTGMACTIDIGQADDVHPKNKQEVGRRLALAARARVYGETDLVDSGPTYASMTVEGDRIRVRFDHLGGGLVCRGDALQTFAIAGADRVYHWAAAELDAATNTVLVNHPDVPRPVAVRYAWANNPAGCNLYNAASLPAVPFRSDDWTEKTRGATKLFIDQ